MKVTSASCSFPGSGGGRENQDALGERIREGVYLYGVSDGLGGCPQGGEASRLCVQALLNAYPVEGGLFPQAMKGAFAFAHQTLRQGGSGRATLVSLVLGESQGLWAHVGDSRLYYFHRGSVAFVTPDHGVSYRKYRAGILSFDAIGQDEDRSALLQVLGGGLCPQVECHRPIPLEPGDGFLLCTDGFWERLPLQEMEWAYRSAQSPTAWLNRLLELHRHRPGTGEDDFSAICIEIT